MYNDYYNDRPSSIEEKAKMLKFLELEKECDKHNALEYAQMNREHLNKTRTKQGDSMVKRWDKESNRLLKKTTNAIPTSLARPRTWL